MSEKFTGHGIVGNNAWARPGGSEQNIFPPKRFARKDPPKISGFYLHRESPRGRDPILSTQRICARPGSNFPLHKEFLKKIHAKSMRYSKIFRAARAQLRFYLGDDASENGDFQIGKQRLEGYKIFRAARAQNYL